MDEGDFDDIEALTMIFDQHKRKRVIKEVYEKKKEWDGHGDHLIRTNRFKNCFRMHPDHFNILLDNIRDAITVDFG